MAVQVGTAVQYSSNILGWVIILLYVVIAMLGIIVGAQGGPSPVIYVNPLMKDIMTFR